MNTLNVWLHCRITKSTPLYLLDYQEDMLRKYAKQHQYHIIGCSKDRENQQTTNKYTLEKIINYIVHRKIDLLIIYNHNSISYDPMIINDFQLLCSYFHIEIIQLKP